MYNNSEGFPFQYKRVTGAPTMHGEASKGEIAAQGIGGFKPWDTSTIQMDFQTRTGDVKVVTNAGGLVGTYDLDSKFGRCSANIENALQESCKGSTNGVGAASLKVTTDYGTVAFSIPAGVNVPSV